MADEMIRFFGRATGRVQGVGFRFFVQQNALEIGLTGWVRNMEDGAVTMEIQGTQPQVDAFAQRVRKGNYFIKVKEFAMEPKRLQENEKSFTIAY